MSDPGTYVTDDAVRTGTVVESGSAERSIGQLVAEATAEMSALVHDEIALVKAEVRQDVKRGVAGGAAGVIGAVFMVFALPVLSFAAAYGIHNLGLGLAWSFLIVGVAFLLIGALLGAFAAMKIKKVKPPQKSIASAKQTAAVLQNVKPHPREAGEPSTAVARSTV
ncbi:phage holin family protein [Streptomyces sp. NPDC093085]|uniref:phage holin family protein n=1 Tax=Streptomyces sp. NPDC093085 TaxID=3155068 RepID=UPI00341EDF3C